MSCKNPTSSIRSGFDFQDLWALKLCAEWLLNFEEYKSLQIETDPSDGGNFYLDDIVLLDNESKYYLYQAKFKKDNKYQWKWSDFVRPINKAKESLFKKWSNSIKSVNDKFIEKAVFVTNGTLSDEIRQFLTGQKIDIQKLKTENADSYKQIKAEIGDDKSVEKFFEKFEFLFESKNIDDIEEEIKKLFYNSLKVTKAGLNNLYIELKKEARKDRTVPLTLDQIKTWCEFDSPRPLNEDFEIPQDFQFFDEKTHQGILEDLQKAEGGVKIIFGKPGVGKSVYLSQLSENLKEQEVAVIKHHYHISPSDSSSFERLNSDRVVEAIKAQLKTSDYKKYLGELANKNSQKVPLKEFISSVAENVHKDKKNVVIVIDGLDHVVREKDVLELKKFLDEIFHPQKGLWIVFGMQPQVKNERSLQSIFNKCPKDGWIEIKALSRNAVDKIIRKNVIELNLPNNKRALESLINKLYKITQGNPLHLRYILCQLKNRLGNRLVIEYECKNLVPYGDNIEEYYRSLWTALSKDAKTILLTLISVDFQFQYQQFVECISSFASSPTMFTQSYNEIEHLIFHNMREKLRIYHNSFEVFLYNQPECEQQKITIKQKTKEWLESSKYENLKWAELKKLEYELGNDKPILKIDKNWLIKAITYPRNASQIESQLKLSAKGAFNKDDFAKALKISHLQIYYQNAQKLIEESGRLIWIESIRLNPKFIDELILDELSPDILVTVAGIANQYGKFYIIDEIIELLRKRLYYQEYRTGTVPLVTESIIKILPYDREHKVERIYKYIVQFRDLEISDTLFGFYTEKFLYLEQKTKLEKLLSLDLNNKERKKILEKCIRYDLAKRESDFVEIIEKEKEPSIFEQLYLILQKRKLSVLPKLPGYKDFPLTIPEYGSERVKWTANLHKFFLTGLIYGFSEKQEEVEEWTKSAPSQWLVQATSALFKSALKIANIIQKEQKIYYKDIFDELKYLSDLKWPEDRDRLEFKYALKNALSNIFKNIITIKDFLKDSPQIDKRCYQVITSTPFFLQNDVFELVLDLSRSILEKDVYKSILNEKILNLQNTIGTFPERSEEYAKIAAFSGLYKEDQRSKELLIESTDNFLGYGYHKDIYLFDVLEAIEFCVSARVNLKKINGWIKRVIPLITNVGEYTDGDETNHLPNYLASFFSKYKKDLLFKFYFSKADQEELYPAQEFFQYIIRSFSLEEDIEIALATTALDKDSLKELKEKAKTLKGAKKSLNIIQDYLGKVNYKEENYSTSPSFKKEKVDYAEVKPKKLEKHLSKLKSKWDFEEYITGWTKYWLEKQNKQKIYNLVKSVVFKSTDAQSVSGEVLDILYPLAYEFGNTEAFQFLCLAQTNDYGWARYWTDKKKAEKRWDFVKRKYPKRYLEFFKSSANHGVPLSRGVEFFVRFKDLDKAITITEASVAFAEELMADLKLPNPNWVQEDFEKIDELDLLLQRLVWPSPLVRERAATAIGNLLVHSSNKKEIYKQLLNWIRSWKIESIVAIGLLPIIKAFQISDKKTDLSFVGIEEINNSIQVNSVVIECLLSEIVLQTKEKIKALPNYAEAKQPPSSHEPNEFFGKYIKTLLAPIYFDRAKEIEQNTLRPFTKWWAYNAEIIAQENGIDFSSNHYFYGHNKNDKFLTGFSTKVSEVYRSAFLRVLYDFYKKRLIQVDFYYKYAFATLPVDLSFWKIIPNRIPEWWPKLIDYKTSNEKSEITTIQFREPIENIIRHKEDDNIIIAAEGAIEPGRGWKENPMHSFSLIGFGYKVVGASLPNPEEVAEKILNIPQTLLISTKADHPLCFLENNTHFDINSDKIQIKNLVILPLITRNRGLTINLWQYFREKNQSFNINERLCLKLQVVIKKDEWAYEDKNNNEVVKFVGWLEGLQERYEFEASIPHGQYLETNKKFLSDWLDNEGLRLGYLLNVSCGHRKYGYDEIKRIDDFKLFNVSKIIVSK